MIYLYSQKENILIVKVRVAIAQLYVSALREDRIAGSRGIILNSILSDRVMVKSEIRHPDSVINKTILLYLSPVFKNT